MLTQDAPKMSEANRWVDSAEPNPVGVHKHPRSRSPQSLLTITFVAWRFGDSEFWRGADFVAQQRSLPCATNDAVLRNKGVGGCARRLAERGVVSSKERSAHLSTKRCAPFRREVRTSS